jgi:hypothetical protein
MAKLASDIQFTGSLGNLSAYKMRGVDKIILRRKGGPTPASIKTKPAFDLVRRNNAEFSGRATASRWIMGMMWPQKALADYNIAGPLNALIKPIQELDQESILGQRHIELSKNKLLLQGFSLNRKNPFDSVVRAAGSYTVSREHGSAHVELPELWPEINFFSRQDLPFFGFQLTLGVVPDLFYQHGKYLPISSEYQNSNFAIATTPWQTTRDHQKNITFHLSVPKLPMDDAHSFILTIGIRYGTMRTDGTIEQRKHSGCAKVLAVF